MQKANKASLLMKNFKNDLSLQVILPVSKKNSRKNFLEETKISLIQFSVKNEKMIESCPNSCERFNELCTKEHSASTNISTQSSYLETLISDENELTSEFVKNVEFDQKYEIVKFIGQGKFGQVYLVKERSNEHSQHCKLYAAKQLEYDYDEDQILKEWKFMENLDHPLIVKPQEIIFNKAKQTAILIMEYFEGESLDQILKLNTELTEQSILQIMKQLMEVLNYLESQKIVHRDISLKNILYSQTTQQIKLIDFGISFQLSQDDSESYSPTINDKYKPPEFFSTQYKITNKIDVYTAGLVFASLMLRTPIYSKKNHQSVLEQIGNLNIIQIIEHMLKRKVHERASANEILILIEQNLNL